MATSTTNYSFSLPEVGGDTDQWGTQLNNNWTLADSTIKTIEDSVVDVTLTGNNYLTISGQTITVGDVDLTADVTGTLPVGSGGTGLAAIGSADQVLGVNSGGTALEYKTLSTGGTVTSVAVTGADGIEVDSGSPITSSGTIALGINSTSLSTHLGLGSLATQSTITESQISDLGSYITASSTDTLTNKSGNISQWTNDSGYLTAEVNDLSAAVTWANVPDANITQSSVTQHQASLSITESQISDFGSYQTSDAGLTSIAALTTTADKMLYTTASDTYAVATLTSAGRALLDDADAAAQRTTLNLGSMATQNANAVAITGGTINTVQPATGQSLTIKDEDGNTAITVGTDNTAAGYLSLNFGSYHGDSGGAGSGSLSGNTLSDYEFGTWTPTATAGFSGYTNNRSSYTKIGRLVYIQAYLSDLTGKDSNAVRIGGLPFTAGSLVYSGGFMDTGSAGDVGYVRISSGSSNLSVYSWDASSVHRNDMTGSEVGSLMIFSLVYEVA